MSKLDDALYRDRDPGPVLVIMVLAFAGAMLSAWLNGWL